MKPTLSAFFALLLFPLAVLARPNEAQEKQLRALEDSLRKTGPLLFKGTDQVRGAANQKFIGFLKKALAIEGAFDYPFAGLDSAKVIANLKAPDNSFRIFNWNLPKTDGTHLYYGFLLADESKTIPVKKKGMARKPSYKLYELTDKSNDIKGPEMAVLSADKWYGALYYKIILTNDKDKKYYTLLGWDGNNAQTWKKLIDVVTFARDGQPVFGEKSLFDRGRHSSRRVIFEFRAELVMTLRYEDDKKRIVFDHLAPEVASATGMYQFYSQTFSYDSFDWKKGKWQMKEDIDARNEKDKKDGNYVDPNDPNNPNRRPPQAPGEKKGFFIRIFGKKQQPQPF